MKSVMDVSWRFVFAVTLFATAYAFANVRLRAADEPPTAVGKDAEKKPEEKKPDEKLPPLTVTEHDIVIEGRKLHYRATAGYLPLRDAKDEEKRTARVFFVAYTLEGVSNPATRPVTFAFNGGPGSASLWLHLGALGPKRIVTDADGSAKAPPYDLVDNEACWLDQTDLVFIDPVSTGYSRPEPKQDGKPFHGYEEDVKSVGNFIRLWTSRNERWGSPKFLVGESYGGVRASGLSRYLQEDLDLYCNGVVLLSPALDFTTLGFGQSGNNLPYELYLPTYTAAAWKHGKLKGPWAATLESARKAAEEFSDGDYAAALRAGDRLEPVDRARIAGRLAELTGIPAPEFLRRRLRLDPATFRKLLLADDGKYPGRYDARVVGIMQDADRPPSDPSYTVVGGAFVSGINRQLRTELKFESDLPYEPVADVGPWKYPENRYLNAAAELRQAMISNPALRVWVLSGYYDMATPYRTVDYTLRQLDLDPAARARITRTYYDAGHMMYVVPAELAKLRRDYLAWMKATLQAQGLAASR